MNKKLVIGLLMLCAMVYSVSAVSCGVTYLDNWLDYGDVEKGKTYSNARVGIQPYDYQCVVDGYSSSNCPYEIYTVVEVNVSYAITPFVDGYYVSWDTQYINVTIDVPEDIETGLNTFQVCGLGTSGEQVEGIGFRTGACATFKYNALEDKKDCDRVCKKLLRQKKNVERKINELQKKLNRYNDYLEEYNI